MKNQFPTNYPTVLKAYSWNINGKYGIMPYFTKYCNKSCQKESPIFIKNCIYLIFQKNKVALTVDLENWANYFLKCFSVQYDEDQEYFKVKIKMQKDMQNIPIFNTIKYVELSSKIGLSKKESNDFIKFLIKNIEEFYGKYIK